MLPVIGQIILVHPAFFTAERKIAELHLMRIVAEADSPLVSISCRAYLE